jgi:hypothetical protein
MPCAYDVAGSSDPSGRAPSRASPTAARNAARDPRTATSERALLSSASSQWRRRLWTVDAA